MAQDYLAIQGSAMPSERAFSRGGIMGTPNHNRFSIASFKALQILKSAYHNGHIAAMDDAAKHLDNLFDVSEAESTIGNYPSSEPYCSIMVGTFT